MNTRWPTLEGTPTRVIAHRGASGVLPEHTLEAYALALTQGADVIEPDLMMSRDGVLMVRHDAGLARSTNVADIAALEARQLDGDWPITGFDRVEIETIRARQPFQQRDHSHDARFAIPDYEQVQRWADAAARQRGRPVVLYPELKQPAQLASLGLDPVPRLVDAIRRIELEHVKVWVQCFEIDALRRMREATGVPCYLLLDADADWRAAIERHGGELDGFGASKHLLFDANGAPSGLVDAAHAKNLRVHAWTYRDDQLAARVARVEDELEAAFRIGVDAVFCDFPDTAIACRQRWSGVTRAAE